MPLTQNSYGKSAVRLTKIIRNGSRHDFVELSASVQLHGDFADSYLSGDNSRLIATDSMKNTVYVLAAEHSFQSVEEFAAILANHFVNTYSHVQSADVKIEQSLWNRIEHGGEPHEHSFVSAGNELHVCRAIRTRGDAQPKMSGGVSNLVVLKTTASEFHTFVTDRYRTLQDTRDRIFATSVEANWDYARDAKNYEAAHEKIRGAMLETFATHYSLAVQQTLLEMGEAALAACGAIDRIELTMPNQHRIPFNLEPFGLKNDNSIFVPTDEPFGLISGTIERKK